LLAYTFTQLICPVVCRPTCSTRCHAVNKR